jgi:RNA polymerase-binding transcription factor DksA
MTSTEVETYRRRLVSLRDRMTGDVSHLKDEALRGPDGEVGGNLSHTPIHMADLGTDSFEQEFTLSLVENEEQTLTAISEALERIQKGTFGRCEECHKEIGKARLQALPFTPYCVECARKLQQSE